VRKNFVRTCVKFCTITDRELFEPTFLTSSGYCLWDWMRSEVYETKLDATDELLTLILDAAASKEKREY